jgi:UDPglucose--hexose-1-phosphate uridylyltransferase
MINSYINGLVSYAVKKGLIEEEDSVYSRNRILALLKLDDYKECEPKELELHELLKGITDFAVEKGLLNDSITERDIFDTELMAIFTDRPSSLITKYNELYKKDPMLATNWYYELSCNTNYIRKNSIAKDVKWKTDTEYGTLDITINLSKPEKDPKAIAAMRNAKVSQYPACQLCKENESYIGRLNHPARGNHRIIPVSMEGEDFFLQYTPYVYYNEHCIVFNKIHKPMIIDKPTLRKLLSFVDYLPLYFIGSNAELPIVGVSILAHEHFQGGHNHFAVEDAKPIYEFTVKGYPNSKLSIVKWPLSVIRVYSSNKDEAANLGKHILNTWINYSDEEVSIYAYTDGVRHNTITPCVRKKNGLYEMDLVLRNNLTTEEYPLGLSHPHPEYHHIKKENIGLIEVMGLAILPARLKKEIQLVEEILLGKSDITEETEKHKDRTESLKKKYTFTEEIVDSIVKEEIGITFGKILENAGVYKMTDEGIEHFIKFTKAL